MEREKVNEKEKYILIIGVLAIVIVACLAFVLGRVKRNKANDETNDKSNNNSVCTYDFSKDGFNVSQIYNYENDEDGYYTLKVNGKVVSIDKEDTLLYGLKSESNNICNSGLGSANTIKDNNGNTYLVITMPENLVVYSLEKIYIINSEGKLLAKLDHNHSLSFYSLKGYRVLKDGEYSIENGGDGEYVSMYDDHINCLVLIDDYNKIESENNSVDEEHDCDNYSLQFEEYELTVDNDVVSLNEKGEFTGTCFAGGTLENGSVKVKVY